MKRASLVLIGVAVGFAILALTGWGAARWDGLNAFYRELGSLTPAQADVWVVATRKALHVVLYAALVVVLARWALAGRPHAVREAVLLVGLVALADEGLQLITPHRTARWTDLLVDAAGMAVGAWMASKVRRREGRAT